MWCLERLKFWQRSLLGDQVVALVPFLGCAVRKEFNKSTGYTNDNDINNQDEQKRCIVGQNRDRKCLLRPIKLALL